MNTTDETIQPESGNNPIPRPRKPRLTPEQRAAVSRANGARSRGPATAQGLYQSSKSNLRHGMLARSVVLPTESAERFRALVRDFEAEFRPATPNECRLVEAMAAASWRQTRAWSLGNSLLGYEIRQQLANNTELAREDQATRTSATVRHLADNSHSLELIYRFEMGFARLYQRLHATLLTAQAARKREARESESGRIPPTC